MRQSSLFGRAVVVCLVMSAGGACRTSAAPKGPVIKPPLVAVEAPPDAERSKWARENWKLHQAALAKEGLAAVRLTGWLPPAAVRSDATWAKISAETTCKVFENLPGAPPRLLHGSGNFVVSADGKVHCLVVELGQALGLKKETLQGPPRNCSTGAQLPTQPDFHLYVLPEGVPVGEPRTVRVPYYDLDIRYEERCPMVPSAAHR